MESAHVILSIMAGYALIGTLAGLGFVFYAVERVDPAMRKASLAVRLLILPGSVALWPLLLNKWRKARAGRLHS